MIRMWVPIIVFLFVTTTSFLGQDLTSGGPDSIIAGAFGEPRMVMSEGGQWSYPIKVFTDKDVEAFVPDITSQGWNSWHIAEFRDKGIYFTYLYVYHRNSRKTGRETIYVDTRGNTVIVVRPLLRPVRMEISKTPQELSKSIAKITAIITDSTSKYHGSTVQEDILREKIVTVRMALCSGPGAPNPDCNVSDADFAKKYPFYATTSLHLTSGTKPDDSCGIGTDKSCCCADNSAVSNNPASSPMSNAPGVPTDRRSALSVSEYVQLLSDTEGLDFGSWLTGWRQGIESVWYARMATLRGPHGHGAIVIRVKVLPDGHVMDNSLVLEGRSSDAAVDSVARDVLLSSPSSPLPTEFHAPYMEMRVTFVYSK